MKLVVMGIINKKPKRLVRSPVPCCFVLNASVIWTMGEPTVACDVAGNYKYLRIRYDTKVLFWEKNAMPVHFLILG